MKYHEHVRHQDRRKEAGKMFIDISKYIITVGVVGGMAFEKVSVQTAIAIFMVAILSFITGFYMIPPKEEQ